MTYKTHYWLFVYGPYMNPKYLEEHGIKYYSSQKASLADYDICFSTRINNWKLALIDLEEKKGHRLEGVLYEIDKDALQVFDGLEKVSEGKHNRIEIQVQTEGAPIYNAYTYLCPNKEGHFKPSKEYVDFIVEGARINNLSEEHILHIRSYLE